MTSTQNSTGEKRYSAAGFFRFTSKRNGQHFALYLILMLFGQVLPCYMMIDNMREQMTYTFTTGWLERSSEEIVQTSSTLAVLLAAFIAMLAGMSALAYVNDKTAVGCYHSFPIRRESMFFTETLTRALYFLISYAVGAGISYLLMRVSLELFPQYEREYLLFLAAGLVVFCLTYSIVLFAGGLCGTNLMKFLMTGVILLLPLLLYVGLVYMADVASENLDLSYYFTKEILARLSPVWDAAYSIDDIHSGSFRLWHLIPEALAFYAGALLLHKYRRSEDSGTTIIWKPVFHTVKYLLIFTASLLGAYILYEGILTGSSRTPLKMFLGAFAAAVLAFMVANCLLYRSSRAMFRDLKPFGICCVGIAAFLLLVPLNVTGLVGKTYSLGNTKSVELTVNDVSMTFRDPEELEWLIPMTNPAASDDPLYTEEVVLLTPAYVTGDVPESVRVLYNQDAILEKYPEGDRPVREAISSYTGSTYCQIVQKPKFGIPLAKNYPIDTNAELWDRISATVEYAEKKNELRGIPVERLESVQVSLLNQCTFVQNIDQTTEKSEAAGRMLQAYRYHPESRLNATVVGTVELTYDPTGDGERWYNAYLPIYTDNPELIAEAADFLGMPAFADTEELFAYTADFLEDALLVDLNTAESRALDRESLIGLLGGTTRLDFNGVWMNEAELKASDVPYLLIVASAGDAAAETYQYQAWEMSIPACEVRFRAGAFTEEELSAVYRSLN